MSSLDINVPDELEGTQSVLRAWLRGPGDLISADEPIAELETDKVTMEISAPAAGVLQERFAEVGEELGAGALIARMTLPTEAAADDRNRRQSAPVIAPPQKDDGGSRRGSIASFDPSLRLSPSVRRRLMETGLDPFAIKGTGRDGRITAADVEAAASAVPANPLGATADAPVAAKPSDKGPVGRLKPHDSMRLRIAENMARSVATAPHVTAVFEADFGAIMADRKARRGEFEARGVALTYTAYIVAACVKAMAAAPSVNSRWRDDALELFDDINIGVGTALGEKGLIVPVVHQAQTLSLFGVASRLQDMTERARTGKLSSADVKGGTFSISNHGVSGSLVAAPIIINQPQSAILGVGKLEKRVVVREIDGADALAIRPMAYVSLTIDHRVLDGHQTNGWLRAFVDALETWPSEA